MQADSLPSESPGKPLHSKEGHSMITWKRDRLPTLVFLGLPGGSDSKESACNAGDLGLIPGSGRSPGDGNGNPLQYSCLGNPIDRGAWRAAVYGVARVGHN